MSSITQTGTIQKLRWRFLCAFHSNYGRIFNCLRYSASKYCVTLKTGLRVVKIIENGAVR